MLMQQWGIHTIQWGIQLSSSRGIAWRRSYVLPTMACSLTIIANKSSGIYHAYSNMTDLATGGRNSTICMTNFSIIQSDGGSGDATWILTSAFIIFTMQSGFGLLEAGKSSPPFLLQLREGYLKCHAFQTTLEKPSWIWSRNTKAQAVIYLHLTTSHKTPVCL